MDLTEAQSLEDQIISKALDGDTGSFAKIFNKYFPSISRYFYFHVLNRKDAEDLAGLVFLKAWKNLHRYRSKKGSVKTWLYRIAHNTLIDHYRKNKPTEDLDEEVFLEFEGIQMEERLIAQQQVLELQKALQTLDRRSRSVLIYRFIAELDHRETAKILGISESNVRVIQTRALRKLRRIFVEGTNEKKI